MIANAFRAGFHLVIHRAWPLPVGSSERVTKYKHFSAAAEGDLLEHLSGDAQPEDLSGIVPDPAVSAVLDVCAAGPPSAGDGCCVLSVHHGDDAAQSSHEGPGHGPVAATST